MLNYLENILLNLRSLGGLALVALGFAGFFLKATNIDVIIYIAIIVYGAYDIFIARTQDDDSDASA